MLKTKKKMFKDLCKNLKKIKHYNDINVGRLEFLISESDLGMRLVVAATLQKVNTFYVDVCEYYYYNIYLKKYMRQFLKEELKKDNCIIGIFINDSYKILLTGSDDDCCLQMYAYSYIGCRKLKIKRELENIENHIAYICSRKDIIFKIITYEYDNSSFQRNFLEIAKFISSRSYPTFEFNNCNKSFNYISKQNTFDYTFDDNRLKRIIEFKQ
jgi:hypothetical protein